MQKSLSLKDSLISGCRLVLHNPIFSIAIALINLCIPLSIQLLHGIFGYRFGLTTPQENILSVHYAIGFLMMAAFMVITTKMALDIYNNQKSNFNEIMNTLKKVFIPAVVLCILFSIIRNLVNVAFNTSESLLSFDSPSVLIPHLIMLAALLILTVFQLTDVVLVDQQDGLIPSFKESCSLIKPFFLKMFVFLLLYMLLLVVTLGLAYPIILMTRIDIYKKLKSTW